MSAGISDPRRDVAICLVGIAVGAAALAFGLLAMDDPDLGTAAQVAIGLGLLLCLLFPLFLFNFLWALRLTNAMRRGEGVIARWTVPAQTLEEFRVDEEKRRKAGRANDWKVPKRIPAEGLEVIFSASAVMIGKSFFGLAKSGLARFGGVQTVPGNPLAIAFAMALTTGRMTSSGSPILSTWRSELRVPVARGASAEASKVLAHFQAVSRGRTVARPGFWPLRIRIGLWWAGIAAAIAALGFILDALQADLGEAPMIMAVAGTVAAPGGLLVALIAWLFHRGETRGRRR
ncbi:MAG: hypothetical protein AB7O63_08545 [Reyranellaceae bacterium]